MSETEKSAIQAALEKCKKAKDTSQDAAEIKSSVDELTKASHKLAEHMYSAAQGQAAGGAGASGEKPKSGEEEVVEAEFEDVDKNK